MLFTAQMCLNVTMSGVTKAPNCGVKCEEEEEEEEELVLPLALTPPSSEKKPLITGMSERFQLIVWEWVRSPGGR